MKRTITILILILLCLYMFSCSSTQPTAQVVATTAPVYEFASRLCAGTDIEIALLVSEEVSCLHDYTLQTRQMQLVENAQVIIISGAGLEAFLDKAILGKSTIIDASVDVPLICANHDHEHHDGHDHADTDPHIWLAPNLAKQMVQNIYTGLLNNFPSHGDRLSANLSQLLAELDKVQQYADQQLLDLSCRNLVTFHDGFGYMAEAFNLNVLHSIEEESGSEASAAELIELIKIVTENDLPAIFTEVNGSPSAAQIIAAQTGVKIFQLDTAMSGAYFTAMYHNIDTLKEALE